MNGTHHFYPTAHGDWYVIDGRLVDLSQGIPPETSQSPQAVTGSDVDGDLPISLPPLSPASGKRRKPTSED